MNTIYALNEKHVTQLHRIYQQEWWTKTRSLEETKNCVAGSQICIGLVDEADDLIGFSRVLTDFTFKALIFDVIVHSAHRKKGIGDKLLSLIREHPKLKSVKHFELYCLPEMYDFYAKHGFTTGVGEIWLMRFTNA